MSSNLTALTRENDLTQQIQLAIAKLRQLVRVEVQYGWLDVPEADIKDNFNTVNLTRYQPASVNQKGYIIFPQGRQIKWLVQKITVPPTLQGYPLSEFSLRLVLTWWAEDAQISIDGKLVQQGDLFDSSARILVTDAAKIGDEYIVAIRLVSPGHDIGALMRSHLIYERVNRIDPGLVADELTVLLKYVSRFAPQNLEQLATEIDRLDWNNLADTQRFDRDLANLRDRLLPLAQQIKQRCFNLLSHAHLDMAWLWTTAETYEIAQRTFKSVLSLQQDFPNLTFGHTSPALYEWIERHRPELFAEIQNAVRLGKWEVLGGMWIEPEVNLINGESLIRQLLYGQQYYQNKFGEITKIAWLPDSFGFTWQLPQILKQAGIEYFVTGKLHWNDTTKFPFGCFWWESPDGTKLLTVMSPPNITGVMDTNPITMANYAIDWETQTGLQDIFWLPGVGDHGGGPTRDMLEVAAKWDNSPFFPEIKFTTAKEYLTKIGSSARQFPVWQDELYLELHRGCYTNHADQKQFNRYGEGLLYQAELFATLANSIDPKGFIGRPLFPMMYNTGDKTDCQDWQQYIELAWKKVLFNQFHDILPGTSIPEVFADANRDWKTAIEIGENILQQSLKEIASCIDLPQPPDPEAKPIVVFNALNWKRSGNIEWKIRNANCFDWQVYDVRGDRVSHQITADNQLLFLAKDIPGVGYSVYWILRSEKHENITLKNLNYQPNFILENKYIKVKVNSQTGDLDSIYDKIDRREILSGSGNQLQAFEDKGQYWDAWNIDPEYEQYPLGDTELKSIQWLEDGELRQRIRVIRKLNKSEFVQDYILEKHSPILKIANTVNWQETHVVVKAAFPLAIANDNYATYEIPCGAIQRPTKPQTEAERTKWEVSALKWADLTDNSGEYGVSLLNDCKYGYDSKPNQLRLTLLRAAVWPDPEADRGIHQFTYAVYPHRHDWKAAKTVHQSYELNIPLQTVSIDNNQLETNRDRFSLSPVGELLNLSADNLILMALKPSKDNNLILRCYECHGDTADLFMRSDLNFKIGKQLNLLETPSQTEEKPSCKIQSWKIATFSLNTN